MGVGRWPGTGNLVLLVRFWVKGARFWVLGSFVLSAQDLRPSTKHPAPKTLVQVPKANA